MNIELLNINLNDFHFLRPVFLWLLVPAIISLVLGLVNIRKQARWQKHIAPHLRPFVIKAGSEMKIQLIRIISIFIFSIAILGLAGPTWKKIEIPGQILETPVVIVLDMSQSMMATDIQPNRLERAKFKIHDFLKANPKARTALIGFAGTAHTIVPLTADYNIILNHLDGLKPELIPIKGSNLEAALRLSDTLTQVTEAPSHIILFSDDFTEDNFTILREFAANGNTQLEIIPMNTVSGADIRKPGTNAFFKDKAGSNVHSALNQGILTKLNAIENITAGKLTLDKSDVEFLAKKIGANLKFQEKDKEKEDDWEDKGLWFTIPLILLALLWFRKGWVIFSFLLMIGFTSCNSDNSFQDFWVSKEYQAQNEYNKENYERAAEMYTDPEHKGVAWYKAGDYDKAIESFKKDTTANGAYNLGLSLYKNGNYSQAAVAFEKALELNPQLEQARQNKTMMLQFAEEAGTDIPNELQEAEEKELAQNVENKDMEDLGGGGQEATEKDMEQERKEETVATEMRKGKELEEVPDDFQSVNAERPQNIVMQKVDDDPALFLKRKFQYQLKKGLVEKPKQDMDEW